MSIEIKVPALGESVTSALVNKFLRKVGDFVEKDEGIIELETDKVTLEVPSSSSGVITDFLVAEGDEVGIGDVLCVIDSSAKSGGKVKKAEAVETAVEAEVSEAKEKKEEKGVGETLSKASLAADRLLKQHNIPAESVQASGPKGHIVKGDVLEALQEANKKASEGTSGVMISGSESDRERGEEVVVMSKLRQVIATRLKYAQNTSAILTTFNEVDMTNIISMRSKLKDDFLKKHNSKLGFMSFFVKASVNALKDFPLVNAEIRAKNIVYKNYYDIGIAVGGPQGLVVPVLRDVDKLEQYEIEIAIADFGMRARDGKLTISELSGGTFTISNGGVFGSLVSTPILNPPQSAILGMHKVQQRPIVNAKGDIVAAPMMYLALSYDHRIVDGKEAVSFLVRIKQQIEEPERLILGV